MNFSQKASVQAATESIWLISVALKSAWGTGMAGTSSYVQPAPSVLRSHSRTRSGTHPQTEEISRACIHVTRTKSYCYGPDPLCTSSYTITTFIYTWHTLIYAFAPPTRSQPDKKVLLCPMQPPSDLQARCVSSNQAKSLRCHISVASGPRSRCCPPHGCSTTPKSPVILAEHGLSCVIWYSHQRTHTHPFFLLFR